MERDVQSPLMACSSSIKQPRRVEAMRSIALPCLYSYITNKWFRHWLHVFKKRKKLLHSSASSTKWTTAGWYDWINVKQRSSVCVNKVEFTGSTGRSHHRFLLNAFGALLYFTYCWSLMAEFYSEHPSCDHCLCSSRCMLDHFNRKGSFSVD